MKTLLFVFALTLTFSSAFALENQGSEGSLCAKARGVSATDVAVKATGDSASKK